MVYVAVATALIIPTGAGAVESLWIVLTMLK